MILRDTSIREPNLPPKDNNFFRNSLAMQLPTTLISGRDCNSPYNMASNYQQSTDITIPNYLAGTTGTGVGGGLLGSRENNNASIVLRESNNRMASHRLLASGIDQRIMKQSTEDCRRLLQQVGQVVHSASCR